MARLIKLQRRDTTRIRIRDLARELCVSPSAVLACVQRLGEHVSSIASNVEAPVANQVRRELAAPPSLVGNAHDTASEVPPELPAPGESQLGAPRRRPRRDNHPLMDVSATTTEVSTTPRPHDGLKHEGRSIIYYTDSAPATPDYSAAGVHEASEAFRHHEWRVRGIDDTEREVWIAHGLSPSQASTAAECVRAGIRPQDLSTLVVGFSILFRVTHGEPPAEVARLRTKRQQTETG